MVTQTHQWYQGLQVERTLEALKKNRFDARFFATAAEALEEVWKMIPAGAKVGVGGSLTLNQVGFFEEAKKRTFQLLSPFVKGLSQEEGEKVRREILTADVFICSSNAVTEDGKLFNIDATGNRVGAMMFGPKKVVLLCGVNKIVKDIGEAEKKVQQYTSPLNARRLGYKTPCTQTGECVDCASPERICNVYVTLAKKPRRTDFSIFLIGESLGL